MDSRVRGKIWHSTACIVGMAVVQPLTHGHAYSQVSGYSSLSYYYHENPLYNYQKISDRIKQVYLEMNSLKEYDLSALSMQYVGGLMMFDRSQDRNFYEHRFRSSYNIRFHDSPTQSAGSDTLDEDRGDIAPDDTTADSSRTPDPTIVKPVTPQDGGIAPDDSTDDFLSMGLAVDARHDKQVFHEFNNASAECSASYRSYLGENVHGRLTNKSHYRYFPDLPDFSNVSNTLGLELGMDPRSGLTYGVIASCGVKYYTQTQYDTTLFEQTRSFVPNPQGKGKTGANLLLPSDKRILIQPATNGTIQFAGAVVFRYSSPGTVIESTVRYQWNLRSSTRYLAQTTSASLLSKDIYNDMFTYEGAGVTMGLKYDLSGRIQTVLNLEFARRDYEVPALNLVGQQIDPRRMDLRSVAEFYVSKSFPLSDIVDFELFVDAEWMRNQSNDDYNDFSLTSISAGIGVDF